ncbi:MAG: Rrf2 family transcriptional regulator [Synergistaceae bacterium]|nr:Rrf2 family transcriptional regulator [Synergistaceae bacterium]
MVDLAENQGDGYITTREIAQRQEVSQKYAERLMALLSRGNFVATQHGKGGGYRLISDPREYKVSDILRAMDEELAPVECLTCTPNTCPRAKNCRTLPMWEKLDAMINDFFGGITLADLMK